MQEVIKTSLRLFILSAINPMIALKAISDANPKALKLAQRQYPLKCNLSNRYEQT